MFKRRRAFSEAFLSHCSLMCFWAPHAFVIAMLVSECLFFPVPSSTTHMHLSARAKVDDI